MIPLEYHCVGDQHGGISCVMDDRQSEAPRDPVFGRMRFRPCLYARLNLIKDIQIILNANATTAVTWARDSRD